MILGEPDVTNFARITFFAVENRISFSKQKKNNSSLREKKSPSLCIRIPAYNDLDSLKQIMHDIDEKIAPQIDDLEVYIIDDGSKDNTWDFLQHENQKRKNLTIERNEINKGFGETLRKVFQPSQKEITFFIPGDNQFPVENFFAMYEKLQSADIVYGVREDRSDKLSRIISSKFYNSLISVLFKTEAHDVNSIFLCKTHLLNDLSLKANSAFIHAEFYLSVLKKHPRVAHVNIKHQSRMFGNEGGAKIKVIQATIAEMLKYRFQNKIQ